ncbi:hypothetical protein EVAR_6028_1 [Eumeta japonica]|uniref:Uncharacterized protein n=1 Tax=Eumeta variegata TaxID=151549 RepID=A0A4C1TAM1_EUMVA|nr:hypothetical protein EVAR_6028_1 [Eumeta japonica]
MEKEEVMVREVPAVIAENPSGKPSVDPYPGKGSKKSYSNMKKRTSPRTEANDELMNHAGRCPPADRRGEYLIASNSPTKS